LSDIGNAEIGAWLKRFSDPSVSGFLYVALASLALGLIISAIRWAVFDHSLRWYYSLRHESICRRLIFLTKWRSG
jgi:hypothetical protein